MSLVVCRRAADYGPFSGLAMCLVLVLAGCSGSAPEADNRSSDPRTVSVRTVVVEAQPLSETLTAYGTLIGAESAKIRSEMAGLVREIGFVEGHEVEAGQLLLRIDYQELQARLEARRYDLTLAKSRVARRLELFTERFISEDEYEEALNTRNALEAEVRALEAALRRTRIVAPFDGVVGLREVSPGAFIEPATLITTIEQLDPLRVDFTVAERFGNFLKPNQTFNLRVAGDPQPHIGTIRAIAPSIQTETRTLRVRGEVPNPGHRLRPGAFAAVEIKLRAVEDSMVVPAEAVTRSAGRNHVFVVEEDDTVSRREVSVGMRRRDTVEIQSGLESGMEVVTAGVQGLRPGSPIRRLESD